MTVQLALRAAATGYQVLVCTERPQRWQQATGAGLQVVAAAGLAEQLPPAGRWMVVYDQVSGPVPAGAAVTVRAVAAGGPAAPTCTSSRRIATTRSSAPGRFSTGCAWTWTTNAA